MPVIQDNPIPNWYALRVAARGEIRIADALRRKGFEVFLPLRTVVQQYSDRVKKRQVALLSGIVFCRFEDKEWLRIIKTPGVQTVVEFERRLAPVPERELAILRSLADSRYPIEGEQSVEPGEAAEVMSDVGPLPCLVLHSGDTCRVAIRLEFMNQTLVLKVPSTALRRSSSPKS